MYCDIREYFSKGFFVTFIYQADGVVCNLYHKNLLNELFFIKTLCNLFYFMWY